MIDLEKAEFKAKLSGKLLDFGFQEDREGFFDWCTHNGLMTFINHVEAPNHWNSFFVYKILKPLQFEMEHIRPDKHPDWTSVIRTNVGNMLVDETYHAKGWPSYAEL